MTDDEAIKHPILVAFGITEAVEKLDQLVKKPI